jgi:hypothetical protein
MTQAPFYWTRDPTTAISIGIQQRKGRKVQTEGEDVKRLLAVMLGGGHRNRELIRQHRILE